MTYLTHPPARPPGYRWNPTDRPGWARRFGGSMPLDPSMINCAALIIGDFPHDEGAVFGEGRNAIGTGFFVTVRSERLEGVRYGYVITARHVLDGESKLEVAPSIPTSRGELYEPVEVTDWRYPLEGVDMALAPWPEPEGYNVSALEVENHVLPVNSRLAGPTLGARVYYIGLLAPLGRAMARSGTIGALDQTGVPHDPPEYHYDCHLLDVRSYEGFSGSPCFVEMAYPGLDPKAVPVTGSEAHCPMGEMHYYSLLCGMFTEHWEDEYQDTDDDGRIVTKVSNYGIGVMVRSDEIRRALMAEDMQDERRGWDNDYEAAQAKAAKRGPRPKRASRSVDHADTLTPTADLMGRLMAVPKDEANGVDPEPET